MHEVKKHQLGVKKVVFFTIFAKKVSKGASLISNPAPFNVNVNVNVNPQIDFRR